MVDEAYADFGARSAVELLDRYPNLVTVHTLSKSRSLAGMRIGYALGSPDLMAAVGCVKNSFNSYPLDRLALAAGQAAMEDVDYFEWTRRQIMTTRDHTAARLRGADTRLRSTATRALRRAAAGRGTRGSALSRDRPPLR